MQPPVGGRGAGGHPWPRGWPGVSGAQGRGVGESTGGLGSWGPVVLGKGKVTLPSAAAAPAQPQEKLLVDAGSTGTLIQLEGHSTHYWSQCDTEQHVSK